MELALQPLNEINFFPSEATLEFSTADRHVYQRLSDITNQWTSLRRELYTKTTVFLFVNNKHYTTVISKPDCMTLLHFDSLNPSPTTEPWEINVVKALFQDEAVRQQKEFATNWKVAYPAIHMTKQIPYSDHSGHSQHIDCGMYAVLMSTLYLLDKSLHILTPPSVHKFRLYAAHRILHAQTIDIAALIFQNTEDRATTTTRRNEGSMSLRMRNEGSMSSRITTSVRAQDTLTLPEHCIQIDKDPASAYTYVSTSSIPGAGNGLFTAIDLQGFDATKALVGEYKGIKRSKEPDNKEYIAGFKKGTKEFIIDAWDAITKCVLCMTGYMNDPLDETKENCEWEVENDRLWVMVKPDITVLAGYELFIAYGDKYWCNIKYSFEILHKAVWRYRNYIDLDPSKHWPQHPLFHDLFNTPYNGQIIFPGRACPCKICSAHNSTSSPSLTPPPSPFPPQSSSIPSATTTPSRKRTRSLTPSSPHHNTQLQQASPPKTIEQLALDNNIDLEKHIGSQLQLPNNTHRKNHDFPITTLIQDSNNDPPNSGKGLFAIQNIAAFTIVGIYEGGEKLKPATIKSAKHKSDYAVSFQGLVRDAYDSRTKSVSCDVARINDALNKIRDNCDWYIHPSFPHLLLVITTKDIAKDEQLFIPYGAKYWCQDKFSVEILRAAVQRYDIDIVNSAEWKKLKKYDQLCGIIHSNQQQLRKSQKINTTATNDSTTDGTGHLLHLKDNQPTSSTTAKPKPKPKSKQQRGVQGQHKPQRTTLLTYIHPTSTAAPAETHSERQEQEQTDNDKTIASSGSDNTNSRKRTTHPTSTDEAQKRQRQQDHNEEDHEPRLRIADPAGETDISTDNIAHSHTIAYDVDFVYSFPCVVQVERQNLFLHEQARQSPTSSGAPSSTAFDKHLVDS